MGSDNSHYDSAYFTWQRGSGQIGGWALVPVFGPFVRPSDAVVDFGCGGGYLLAALQCRERVGIDINPAARAEASGRLDGVYATVGELPESWADVVITNHALEHCERPLDELRALYSVLRPGGRIVVVVPCESVGHRYTATDRNRHLYSWSPMALGHLVRAAGFKLETAEPFLKKWPPKPHLWTSAPRPLFFAAGSIWGRLSRRISQCRAIGTKAY